MNKTKPVMPIFAGTNGAGKSTLSMQIRDWLGELIDPNQIAKEPKADNIIDNYIRAFYYSGVSTR